MKMLIGFLLFPLISSGQTILTGTISDKANSNKIPYATVGLLKENIGTNADENGFFYLKSTKMNIRDTIIISSVGFITQKIPAFENFGKNISIVLVKQIDTLQAITIKTQTKWTFSTLNDFSNCGKEFIGSTGYQSQVAQHFIVPVENAMLNKVKICRVSGGFFNPEKTKFRVRIYGLDTSTGAPGKDFCNEIIEIESKSSDVNINLEKYKIKIPGRDFFIAVEWLKIPYNEVIMKHKINGEETSYTNYRPSIGWTNTGDSKMEAWGLDYKGRWYPLSRLVVRDTTGIRRIFIAATIKY